MKKISLLLLVAGHWSLVTGMASAASQYYTGGYRSPQQNYAQPQYTRTAQAPTNVRATGNYATTGYSRYGSAGVVGQTVTQQQVAVQGTGGMSGMPAYAANGFYINGGVSRESAMWQFDMSESGSSLHYDNISWNVFDVNAGYRFGDSTRMQVDAGLKIGMQGSESSMVDDDITNGGYFLTQWVDTDNNVIGDQIGHALSVGTSSGGSMFGYNIGFGLTDFFKIGNLKMTPSLGWRSMSYALETKKNYGLSVDTAACFDVGGEVQCDPAIIINYDGTKQILWRDDITGAMVIGDNAVSVDPQGTYFYEQPGTSHKYDVEWAGPYVALDMRYDINQYNYVDGRIELGLPGYSSTGDQPYRFDWAHPASVKDEAGMFGAMHLGLGANYNTSISNSVMLSIGLTYNYYSVSGADAKTYLSGTYYTELYNEILDLWKAEDLTEADMLNPETGDPIALNIVALEEQCPGWVCSQDGEIESFYKSIGIRVGLAAKF